MKKEDLRQILAEVERFVNKCNLLKQRDIKEGKQSCLKYDVCKEVASVKRASLDLTRLLSKLRGG